jgi:DNA-binding transcriptional ArsR family regulator
MTRNVRDSTDHEQVVLALLREAGGELSAGELHGRYQTRGETLYWGRLSAPLTKRGLRNVLARLAERGAIDAEGDGSTRAYRLAETDVRECGAGA